MNTDTGAIAMMDEILEQDRDKYVPVKRDLTFSEMLKKQIDLYAPCGCGSGKKFKFCCKTNTTRP